VAKRRRESTVNVFLGNDSSLEGVLSFTGEARLDGSFKGSIKGTGRLWIGPSAKIEADIEAAEVIISGEVKGDVTATERLELSIPGKLDGNISAPLVMMDEGVNFSGHCTMAGSGNDSSQVSLLAVGK
jgi:cytoskeletal protein CcmA (bactofilin family)